MLYYGKAKRVCFDLQLPVLTSPSTHNIHDGQLQSLILNWQDIIIIMAKGKTKRQSRKQPPRKSTMKLLRSHSAESNAGAAADKILDRSPLPTAQHVRSCIPPLGITPAKLSRIYGNFVIGRDLYNNPQRRDQFWTLVRENSRIIEKFGRTVLLPLYNGAYTGPPKPPDWPNLDSIRARIPPEGISNRSLLASFGDLLSGDPAGLHPDEARYRALCAIVIQLTVFDKAAACYKVRFPSDKEFLDEFPASGILCQDLLRDFWIFTTPRMYPRFLDLVKRTMFLVCETGILLPRIPANRFIQAAMSRAGQSQAGPSQAGPSQAGPSQAGPSAATGKSFKSICGVCVSLHNKPLVSTHTVAAITGIYITVHTHPQAFKVAIRWLSVLI